MKKIIFTVVVGFADPIEGSDKDIKEIADNMLKGLYSQADNEGLAPSDETFTTSIEIAHSGVILSNW
jgi:hypothetical protein